MNDTIMTEALSGAAAVTGATPPTGGDFVRAMEDKCAWFAGSTNDEKAALFGLFAETGQGFHEFAQDCCGYSSAAEIVEACKQADERARASVTAEAGIDPVAALQAQVAALTAKLAQQTSGTAAKVETAKAPRKGFGPRGGRYGFSGMALAITDALTDRPQTAVEISDRTKNSAFPAPVGRVKGHLKHWYERRGESEGLKGYPNLGAEMIYADGKYSLPADDGTIGS